MPPGLAINPRGRHDRANGGGRAVTAFKIRQLTCGLVAVTLTLPGATSATTSATLSVATETSTPDYQCQPTLPVFCRNIHVGCSGRTPIATAPMAIIIRGAAAHLTFADGQPPARGQVTSGGDLVIRLTGSRDWIRIEPDGRYSHRIYRSGRAAMGYGICRLITPS